MTGQESFRWTWILLAYASCCCPVTKFSPTLCDSMNFRTPGFPVLHYLPEIYQTQVHWVSDTIQPSHPMTSPSPPACYISQQKGILQWVYSASDGQGIGASASVFPMNIQDSFPLELTGLISLLSKGFPRDFSSTTIWKHQFFCTQPSLWSNSHIHKWLLEKP